MQQRVSGTSVEIVEASQPGEARRRAQTAAAGAGFDEQGIGRVALLVNELAGNLVKHAIGGELLVLPIEQDGVGGLDLVAVDRGPGIADLPRAQRDGFSTAGSPGTGLGAVSRVSDRFDIFSLPDQGTVVTARIWSRRPLQSASEVGAVSLPVRGEQVSGDAYAVRRGPGVLRVCLADGLGHGPGAREAADAALAQFDHSDELGLVALLQAMHLALRPTRGAAVAVAEVDLRSRVVRYAGAGNIAGVVQSNGSAKNLVSLNGTVGHTIARLQMFEYSFPAGAQLVMHSDGCRSRWSLDAYAGLLRRDPTTIAAMLYRDFARGRDDVTVLVARDVPVQ